MLFVTLVTNAYLCGQNQAVRGKQPVESVPLEKDKTDHGWRRSFTMPLKLYPKMRKSVANMGIATKSYVLGTDVVGTQN